MSCTKTLCSSEMHGKVYCNRHYIQVRKFGHILSQEEIDEHRKKEKGVRLNTGKSHFKKGEKSWNTGLKAMWSSEHITAIQQANTGRTAWNKGLYGIYAGDKNPNWKGGVYSVNNALRRTKQYKHWRTSVFERDDYTCQDCGIRGVYLEADHIKPFAFFPDLRFELTNGRTLCKGCHMKTPTYKKHSYKEITL